MGEQGTIRRLSIEETPLIEQIEVEERISEFHSVLKLKGAKTLSPDLLMVNGKEGLAALPPEAVNTLNTLVFYALAGRLLERTDR